MKENPSSGFWQALSRRADPASVYPARDKPWAVISLQFDCFIAFSAGDTQCPKITLPCSDNTCSHLAAWQRRGCWWDSSSPSAMWVPRTSASTGDDTRYYLCVDSHVLLLEQPQQMDHSGKLQIPHLDTSWAEGWEVTVWARDAGGDEGWSHASSWLRMATGMSTALCWWTALCPALQRVRKNWPIMEAGLKMHFGGDKGKRNWGQCRWLAGKLHALACRVQENHGAEVLAHEFILHQHHADLPHQPDGVGASLGQLLGQLVVNWRTTHGLSLPSMF